MKTIDNAVQDAIENFNKFSIHELTEYIRTKINKGEYEIGGLPFEDVDGITTQRIDHGQIKTAFMFLLMSGVLNVNPISYGRYITYENLNYDDSDDDGIPAHTDLSAFQDDDDDGVDDDIDVATGGQMTYTPSGDEVLDKIQAYLKGKGTATLKQIQSRLKTYGFTCAEIESRINNSQLPVNVDMTGPISKWSVTING